MENITNKSIEITNYPQQDRFTFRVKRNSMMCYLWEIHELIRLIRSKSFRKKRFELKSVSAGLFYIFFISSSSNSHLKIILIRFVSGFASSTTTITKSNLRYQNYAISIKRHLRFYGITNSIL